jgi:hypothetical protein
MLSPELRRTPDRPPLATRVDPFVLRHEDHGGDARSLALQYRPIGSHHPPPGLSSAAPSLGTSDRAAEDPFLRVPHPPVAGASLGVPDRPMHIPPIQPPTAGPSLGVPNRPVIQPPAARPLPPPSPLPYIPPPTIIPAMPALTRVRIGDQDLLLTQGIAARLAGPPAAEPPPAAAPRVRAFPYAMHFGLCSDHYLFLGLQPSSSCSSRWVGKCATTSTPCPPG